MSKIRTFFIIFIGASIGGSMRYLISLFLVSGSGFPWGTLFVNLTGAFFLPLLIHYLYDRYHLSATTVLALTTGLIGSYTTFSTMTADTYYLFASGNMKFLTLYLIATMIGGFLFALLGNYLVAIRATFYYRHERNQANIEQKKDTDD